MRFLDWFMPKRVQIMKLYMKSGNCVEVEVTDWNVKANNAGVVNLTWTCPPRSHRLVDVVLNEVEAVVIVG